MLAQSGTRTLVVGPEALRGVAELLSRHSEALTVVGPEIDDFPLTVRSSAAHRFLVARDCQCASTEVLGTVESGSIAYLMFTSGSTGRPKGVPVTFANLASYVTYFSNKYPIGPSDLTSQTFDMTFDLSVHDMFVTWANGACLCPLPQSALMMPARFIRELGLTVWFSVPSLAMNMQHMRLLRPGAFPSLRRSFFCGEPLPLKTAFAWAQACPHSSLVNLYGPTETTIAIAEYEWDPQRAGKDSRYGLIPVGRIFPQHEYRLLDDDRNQTATGRGELCLTGPQVTRGYLNDPMKTEEQFVRFPELGGAVWYRTGDIVESIPSGDLAFVGRVDNQIKINGYRVELQEIDAVLRTAIQSDLAVAVPWPVTDEGVKGIVGCCIENPRVDFTHVIDFCKRSLPTYMLPSRIVALPSLPVNANGKIDRNAIQKILDVDLHQRQSS
jgi:amino acid adenylation domain-containing protein